MRITDKPTHQTREERLKKAEARSRDRFRELASGMRKSHKATKRSLMVFCWLAACTLALAYDPFLLARRTAYQRLVSVGGELWTPADLDNLEAWYDFADSTQYQLDGAVVTNMLDKSGNGWTLINSANPTISNNYLNGLSVLDNTDSTASGLRSDESEVGNFSITGAMHRTVITLARRSTGQNRAIVSFGDASKNGAANNYSAEYYLRFHGTTKGYTNKGANNTWTMAVTVGAGSTLNDYDMFFDGEIDAAVSNAGSNPTTVIDTPGGRVAVGVLARVLTGGLLGQIAEVLILNEAISPADRQRAEGYLSHKWGLTDNLPSGHPYKDNAPTK